MTKANPCQSLQMLIMEGASFLRFWKILSFSTLAFLVSTFEGGVWAQKNATAEEFKSKHSWVDPLAIEPRLSGNFGELRGNHFHTGVDLKTNGKEGLVVLAATDGKIARVKMSPWGYGNALYLEGPDGVTTVYAHLQRFAPSVQAWAVDRTYRGRTLGLDASPTDSDSLFFLAGDTLGWSGNSGGSGGPHLHFELRNTRNQHPLNPLDGWIDKLDTRPPVLNALWAETENHMRSWPLPKDSVGLPGRARLAVEGFDLLNGASNICGLRTLEAKVTDANDSLLLSHSVRWSELDFSVNKDMNAHTFYPVWETSRKQVHRLHRFQTNRLDIYASSVGDGWIDLREGQTAQLELLATDASGNEIRRTTVLVGSAPTDMSDWTLKQSNWSGPTVQVDPESSGQVQFGEVTLSWDEGTFFETTHVGWETSSSQRGGTLHPSSVPYRKSLEVSWVLPTNAESWEGGWSVLPQSTGSPDRLSAVRRNDDGDIDGAEPVKIENGKVVMSLSQGGTWMLERDTIPPKVMPYFSGSPLVENGDAVWYVEDELAGIETIELELDGQWSRVVWDPKRSMVTYESSDAHHARETSVETSLTVRDAVGNETVWMGKLVWP